MATEQPERSVQGDLVCIPKSSLCGGNEAQQFGTISRLAEQELLPSQHCLTGGLLSGENCLDHEPGRESLALKHSPLSGFGLPGPSSLWHKHAIIQREPEAFRSHFTAEVPPQGGWTTEDVLCLAYG